MNRLATRCSSENVIPWFNDIGRNLFLHNPIFNGLDEFFSDVKFPKYNVISVGDNLKLEVALAGYNKEDLNLELSPNNVLTLSSSNENVIDENPDELGYIHRGIASRNFKISWNIGTALEVGDITYENGMLTILLNSKVPEKPKAQVLTIK